MALALALAATGWNQVGCCSRASPPGQFCSAYSSGENQSHDCCNVHCNLFDNNLSVTHCNILAKLPGEFIGNGGGWYRMGKPVGLSLHMNCLHQMVEKLDPRQTATPAACRATARTFAFLFLFLFLPLSRCIKIKFPELKAPPSRLNTVGLGVFLEPLGNQG